MLIKKTQPSVKVEFLCYLVAEEKGFEPLIPYKGYTAFRMRRNQPGYATPPS